MPSGNAARGPITPAEVERLLISKTGADPRIFERADGLSLGELEIDSLAVLELQAVVQEEYGLIVPDDAAAMSVTEIVAHVNSQITQVRTQSAGG